MNVTEGQIRALSNLQDQDISLRKLRKQFEELPQRAKILSVREKRADITSKLETIDKLLAAANKKVDDVIREDEQLAQRQADIQKDIDNAGSDYRNMEARTKEMAGAGRRREALIGLLEEAEAERAKVSAVKDQIATALATLDKVERSETESFKREGGALKAAIIEQEQVREQLASEVDPELLDRYERICTASGIALGILKGNRCGVCRTPLDEVRLLDVKRQAPLATCPNCKRMLIVAE